MESERLRSYRLFADLGDCDFARLLKGMKLERYPPHRDIIREGARPEYLHIVVEGAVQLYSHVGKREASIGVVEPVSSFFVASTIADLPVMASARSVDRAVVAKLSSAAIRDLFEQNADFTRAVTAELIRSFRSVTADLKAQRMFTSLERLATWILEQETLAGGHGRFEIHFDKRTLAARLGMKPENLSRNFARLADYGVEVRRREVTVTDREALAKLATPADSDGPT